jgi:hypothetical protein
LCWQTVEQQFNPALAIASAVSVNYYSDMKTIPFLTLLLVFLTASCVQNSSRKESNSDKLNDPTTNFESIQNSRQDSMKIANKNFRISDSSAIRILKNVKEIQTILENKYKDSTIKNNFLIGNFPTNQSPFWEIELYQFQPRIDKMYPLLFLFVNANSGQISLIDNGLSTDKKYTIEEWRNLKKK